jgi:hypothetical protein
MQGMTMLEKMARAMCEDGGWPWDVFEAEYLHKARVALQALREPDEGMVEAMCEVGPDTNAGCFDDHSARSVFTTAIDHIIKGESGHE